MAATTNAGLVDNTGLHTRAHTHDGLCVQTPGIVSDTLEMPDPHHGSCPLVVVVVVVVWLLHEVLPRL